MIDILDVNINKLSFTNPVFGDGVSWNISHDKSTIIIPSYCYSVRSESGMFRLIPTEELRLKIKKMEQYLSVNGTNSMLNSQSEFHKPLPVLLLRFFALAVVTFNVHTVPQWKDKRGFISALETDVIHTKERAFKSFLQLAELNLPVEGYNLTFGCTSVQGCRPSMEDTEYLNGDCETDQYTSAAMFAVFDGHGGTRVSEFLKKELPERLMKGLIKGKEEESIVRVFQDTDRYVIEKSSSEGKWGDGSCAVVAFIHDGVLTVANLGDSEGILIKKGQEFIPVTTVHKGTTPEEVERIVNIGGKVFYGRVFGMLAVTRAFGDIQYKQPLAEKDYVIATPSIFQMQLDESCQVLILACDGLWDVCSHEQATKLVETWMTSGKTPKAAADLLVEYALANGSTDNITVVVVQIHWGMNDVLNSVISQSNTVSQGNARKRPDIQKASAMPITLSLPEAPVYLKTVAGITLQRSYFYMSDSHHYFCTTKLKQQLPLPCWVSQELISRSLFGDSGVRALKLTENHHQRFFLWATEFSNVHTTFLYAEQPIVIDGVSYSGPEHYFQGQKSVGTPDAEKAQLLLKTADPDQAYGIGRSCQMRADWESVKDKVMLTALTAKFTQHPELKELLLETGDNLLVQLKPNDSYWGTGPNGKGKNRHAEILMQVRTELKQ